MKITILYTFFALIATAANIGSQDITSQFYTGEYQIFLALFVGTATGLIVKYILDKKFIFKHRVDNLAEDSRVFVLYTITGIVTTVIFWGFEFAFDYYYQSKSFRYLGGIIGLSIGYVIKYQLDKRYVFCNPVLENRNQASPSSLKITFLYTLFALFATAANIASQEVTSRVYIGEYQIFLALFVGTGVGLVIKYILDKKFIFKYKVENLAEDSRTFVLYTVTGIVTTVIFWGLEYTFDYYYQTKTFRYLGGIIGLSIGYLIKYQLDKRFVFNYPIENTSVPTKSNYFKIAYLYTVFAIIATIANIGSQDICIRLYNDHYGIILSLFIGTGIGLIVKYILDKKYIFKHKVKNVAEDTRVFILYTLTGVLTTLIFWGFEYGFDYHFQSKMFRYLGGIIGLSIGYLLKYQLDKRFVFNSQIQ